MSISNATRIEIERSIVRKLIRNLGKVGYKPCKVWDGGEYINTPTIKAAMDAVFAVDEATLHFKPPTGKWGSHGVLLIGGNGEDIASDWHCQDEIFNAAIEKTLDIPNTKE